MIDGTMINAIDELLLRFTFGNVSFKTRFLTYLSMLLCQACPVGPEYNILEPGLEQYQRLWLEQPLLSLPDMEMLRYIDYKGWNVSSFVRSCSVSFCFLHLSPFFC